MKLFLSTLLLLPATLAQDSFVCTDAAEDSDCVTCLTAGCVQAVGQCLTSCDVIADAACWDMQYHPNKTVEEVCAEKATIEEDQSICGELCFSSVDESYYRLSTDISPLLLTYAFKTT